MFGKGCWMFRSIRCDFCIIRRLVFFCFHVSRRESISKVREELFLENSIMGLYG